MARWWSNVLEARRLKGGESIHTSDLSSNHEPCCQDKSNQSSHWGIALVLTVHRSSFLAFCVLGFLDESFNGGNDHLNFQTFASSLLLSVACRCRLTLLNTTEAYYSCFSSGNHILELTFGHKVRLDLRSGLRALLVCICKSNQSLLRPFRTHK